MNKNLIKFFELIYKMKSIDREGWKRCGIMHPESISEHSFTMTIMSMVLCDKYYKDLNLEKVLKLSLVHEIGEILVGDITPYDDISKEDKYKQEEEAVIKIFNLIDDRSLIDVWKEFEANETKEARFVKQLDKLEMAFQAYMYEKEKNVNLQEFFDYTDNVIEDKELVAFYKEFKSLRK